MPDDIIDTETYVKSLMQQRNNALDAVAQLEGLIGTLRKEIADLKRRQVEATAKPATTDLSTVKPEPEANTPPA
jgi:phage shock protein A